MVNEITADRLRVGTGLERLADVRFPLSGLRGDLSQYGAYSLSVGIATNVELRLAGVIRSELTIRERQASAVPLDVAPGDSRTGDVGDLVLGTVVRLIEETRRRPAMGVWTGVRLPNASERSGIGTNTTDIYLAALLGKRLGPASVAGSVGLGIYADPTSGVNQNDVVLYGLSAVLPAGPATRLYADLNGWISTRLTTPRGTEPRGVARVGADRRIGRMTVDLSALLGLTEVAPNWGIGIGAAVDLGRHP